MGKRGGQFNIHSYYEVLRGSNDMQFPSKLVYVLLVILVQR